MANTEEIYERILEADKLAAAETTAPETATPETPTACACEHHKEGHAAGYLLGVQHATEEWQSRAPVPVAAPGAPTHVMTVDETMADFGKWMGVHGEYWQWEIECLEALRAALVEGDKVHGLFAYTALIEHADGTRVEFQRKPNKKR